MAVKETQIRTLRTLERGETTMREPRSPKGVSPRPANRKVALGGGPVIGSGAGAHPNFQYRGGPIINTPQVVLVFLGDWSSSANQNRATRLVAFMNDLMNSEYMNMLAQYGCGASGSVVSSTFIANSDTDLNRTDIESISKLPSIMASSPSR